MYQTTTANRTQAAGRSAQAMFSDSIVWIGGFAFVYMLVSAWAPNAATAASLAAVLSLGTLFAAPVVTKPGRFMMLVSGAVVCALLLWIAGLAGQAAAAASGEAGTFQTLALTALVSAVAFAALLLMEAAAIAIACLAGDADGNSGDIRLAWVLGEKYGGLFGQTV